MASESFKIREEETGKFGRGKGGSGEGRSSVISHRPSSEEWTGRGVLRGWQGAETIRERREPIKNQATARTRMPGAGLFFFFCALRMTISTS